MAEPTQAELNKFVATVDEFMRNYKRLESPETRAAVYASNNAKLIADFEKTKQQAGILKRTIEATTGAWNAAKRAYLSVTDETSLVIGDAIDKVRSWFGYKPAGDLGNYIEVARAASPISAGALGAVQLPAAAWLAGIVASAFLLNKTMTALFVSIEASNLQRENPELSRSQAIAKATQAVNSFNLFGQATLPLLAAAAFAGWLLLRRK